MMTDGRTGAPFAYGASTVADVPRRTCASLRQRLLDHALAFPDAWEDHPWEEVVAKVGKKVFVFFGIPDPARCVAMHVKLPESASAVLMEDFAEPTGYGLGKAGWVSLVFATPGEVPVELLEDLIDESYRAVAPKRLIAQLDAG